MKLLSYRNIKNYLLNTNELKLLNTKKNNYLIKKKVYKFSNNYIKQVLKNTIYCNLSNTIYSHVEYGYLEKASFKNCQNNECILLFENKIYDKHQVKHVQTLNYYNNVKLLYQFFIQLLKFNLQFNFI